MPREYSGEKYELDPVTGLMKPKKGAKFNSGGGVTPQQKLDWLKVYRETSNFGKACKIAGIERSTVYSHFEFDIEFEKKFREAVEELCDDKEEQINLMSTKNLLAAFGYLKAYRPHIWNEKKIIGIEKSNVSKLQSILDKMKKSGKLLDVKPIELLEDNLPDKDNNLPDAETI